MQQQRKGTPLIVIGIIMVVIGIGLMIAGGINDGNYESHLDSILNYGHRNNTGTTMNSIGLGFIIIGGILAVVGIVMYAVSGKSTDSYFQGQAFINPSFKFNGRFTNMSHTYSVDLNKDGSCVWMQLGMRYSGFYRYTNQNEWTIYLDNFGEAFKFSLKGEDLFVTGGPVNERFFCEVRW